MKQIQASEVEQLLEKNQNVNIIDVREVSEVANGKIPGAIHIPLRLLEARMPELDKKESYIIVCHAGGRSMSACQFLESYGYKVENLTGGMLTWEGELEFK